MTHFLTSQICTEVWKWILVCGVLGVVGSQIGIALERKRLTLQFQKADEIFHQALLILKQSEDFYKDVMNNDKRTSHGS